jgi:O-antigen/teichoic acid export membrane protein
MADERAPALPAPAVRGRLRDDVLITYAGKVATLVGNLLISVLLARQLGPSGRGSLAVAFSFAQILAQLGSLGLATANPYFAATRRADVGALVSTTLWFAGVVGFALAGLGAALYAVFPDVIGGIDWATLAIASGIVPAMLAGILLQGIFLGEQRIVEYSAVEAVQVLATFVALVFTAVALDLTPTKALGIMLVTAWAAVAVMLLLLRADRPFLRRPDYGLARRLLKYGVRIYAATILAFLVIRFDILLVNGYLGSANAGIYAVVAGLVEGMYLLPASIGVIVFARIAGGTPTTMTLEVFRVIAVLYGILCLISIPLAEPAIDIMFGSEFSQAVELYYWIVPGVYALGMVTIISNHLAGRGFPIEAVIVWVIGLSVNVAMNVLLLPERGLYIAALASSVSYAILLALHMLLLKREVGSWRPLIPRLGEVRRFLRVVTRRA